MLADTNEDTKPWASDNITVDQAAKLPRILVADDSDDNRTLVVHLLRRLGIVPDLATNGEEAVSATSMQDYDLIFLDVQMPVMCGLEAAKKIRENGFVKPIVALTAHAMTHFRQQCFDAGFTEVLTRPFPREEFERVIKQLAP